jgi:uncharacterized protein (TIGR00106 family)
MAIMEISVIPIGTHKTSVSDYTADTVKILEEQGIKHQICPMGIVAEGATRELLDAANAMNESLFFHEEIQRVITTIRIDDRRDIEHTIERKVKTLKEKVKYNK